MIVTLTVGTKCALMLPREFISPQLTPAKGLIINKLLDSRALVLVEEVWNFKGFSDAPLKEMCTSSGGLRQESWGWSEIPSIIDDEYIIVPAWPHNLMQPKVDILEKMITKSVADFKSINGI